jgi:hypothetical protein
MGVSLPAFRGWVQDGLIASVDSRGAIRRKLHRRSDLEAFAASLAARRPPCPSSAGHAPQLPTLFAEAPTT